MLFWGPGLKTNECDVEYFAEQRVDVPDRIELCLEGLPVGI